MTNFRERAREIKAAGEAERGNFEPTGAPKRLYNYWLNESDSKRANAIRRGSRRENFCHFWRVVAIWAPLMGIRRNVIETKAFAVVSALVALLALYKVLTVTGSLVLVLVVTGIVLAVAAVGVGIGFLIDRFWNKDWNDTAGKIALGTWVLIVAGWFTFLLISAVIDFGWIVFAYIGAILAGIALLVFVLATVSEFISGKRALAKKAEEERLAKMTWEEIDEYLRPTPREPGKIAKFFSGLGDFLILASQIVRVKKWKICPMVDIQQ